MHLFQLKPKGLSLLSLLVLFPFSVKAQTLNPSTDTGCATYDYVGGNLEHDTSNPFYLNAANDNVASFKIDCIDARKLVVAPILQTKGDSFTPLRSEVKVYNSTTGSEIKPGDTIAPGITNIVISLYVEKSTRLTPEDYEFKVNLSFIP